MTVESPAERQQITSALLGFLRILTRVGPAVVMLLLGCSQRDKVINVADDDPDMVAAIAKARATLPQFWEAFEKRERDESDFSLKVKITDQNRTEHFWTTDIESADGRIKGTINNDPNIVTTVKLGDRIEISETNISDWLYLRDGKMVGNHTVKALFKAMPREEVEQIKSMMADP